MYSGAGHKSTPVFILTEEQSRRAWDRTAFFWMQLSGREIDMKRANHLFIVYNQRFKKKKPIHWWVSLKARFLATSQSSPLDERLVMPPAAAHETNAPAEQVSFACRYPDVPQQGSLLSRCRSKQTGQATVLKRSQTLFNSSLHHPLFLKEVKKSPPPSRKAQSRSHYKSKHQRRVPGKETNRNLKTPQSRLKTFNSTLSIHHPSPSIEIL